MEESSPDIVTKYQKLAAEYSKMRAQIAVLKKAVAEEQTKGSEMKEVMKEKDQAIRKLQQEVDCLNFRNLQLTKRVSVLQDDLEAVDEKLKKTKSKGPPSVVPGACETQSILNAELQSRIEENEKLHQQVYASEIEHKKIVADLTSQVDSLQSEIAVQCSQMNEKISKLDATIEKLSQERARTEVTLKNYEKEIKDLKFKEETCKEELQFVQDDTRTKLKDTNRILEEKVLFNDTRFKQLNNLNVPILLRKRQSQLSDLMWSLQGMVSDLVRRLSDLHTYMEQKINSVEQDSEIDGAMKRFAGFLHENAQYLKIVETVFTDFTTRIHKDSSTWLDASNLKGIGAALSKYVHYLDKLLPYLILSIHSENCIRGTTPRLKDIYKKLQIVSQNLTYSFSKLEKSVLLLVEVGSPSRNVTYHVSRPVLIKRIISSLDDLQTLFEEARKAFSAKVVIEHQLPTLTETTKNTDDCILSSLVSVSATIKKITVLMRDNLVVLICEVPYLPRGSPGQEKLVVHPCISRFRERGFKYMALTHQDEAPSIPYELALKNAQTLSSYEDSRENLSQQLEMCKNKVSKLELDKEHWMLEYQLLKTRQSSGGQSPIKSNCDNPTEDEEALQSFVRTSVNQLVSQIQFADSKSVAFQAECDFLHQKLKLAEQRKVSLEQQLSETKEAMGHTKGEHKMMMKSYEDQLSTMSEHLATMNETLTAQKDEIDALKQAASHKISKKLKGK